MQAWTVNNIFLGSRKWKKTRKTSSPKEWGCVVRDWENISITLFGILSRIAAYCGVEGFGGKGHVVGFGLETIPGLPKHLNPLLKSHVGQNICPRNVFGIESQNSFRHVQHMVWILTLSIFIALLGVFLGISWQQGWYWMTSGIYSISLPAPLREILP